MSNVRVIGGAPPAAEGVDQEFIDDLLEIVARARAGEIVGLAGMVMIEDLSGEEVGLGELHPAIASFHMDVAKRRMVDAYMEAIDEPDD